MEALLAMIMLALPYIVAGAAGLMVFFIVARLLVQFCRPVWDKPLTSGR